MIAGIILYILFVLGLVVFYAAAMWNIYRKAGFEGWECLVPIYRILIFLKIIGKPWWWILLLFVPFVNIVILIRGANMLSYSFGKDEGFTAGLILAGFIFIPILGFGDAQYQGPYGDPVLYQVYRDRNKTGFDFEQNKLS